MLVILDHGARRVFRAPLEIIAADAADEVPGALARVIGALKQGRFVAGWLGYELGHALESRLAPNAGQAPLLRLGVFDAPADAPPVAGRAWAGRLSPEWDAAAYAARFDRVKAYIAAGDIYQANLSFRARFPMLGDPRALYEELRTTSGAGHCGYVEFFDGGGEHQILSLSPELFFDLSADGAITMRPMKGTAPRNGDEPGERARLSASAKDRAENLMIVDLIRNDLSRIASHVAVDGLFAVETYPTLHAMVSTVTARLRDGVGVAELRRALFPCGSVTGAPKIRAMEILQALESSPRGAYCGALGCFSPDGSARFNVAIRTLTIHGGPSSERRTGILGLGGGVVQDSSADAEYAECLLKARFLECAPLKLIETLRWDGVFTRLERHLDRLEASARVFGFGYATQAARLALDAGVAGRNGPQRVRLTLDESGIHEASAQALEPDPPHWRWALSPQHSCSTDVLLRHKTSRRELYDAPHPGLDEMVFCNERGEVTEGARSNIFVKRDGVLLTPPLAAGVLPGVLRAELIAQGRAREAALTPGDLEGEMYFGNSLRGLVRAVKP
jgi:para-aminobenzoate synthetase/4-amino-4-deoxychorismate lyase